ncbi:uncharacterized protein [Nicotiana sylvestris]|uniref:uncharacterized protein n=1 Tax=Nicotiana sylvestris TaxID=4096 RepID=UPI00388CB066
MLTIYNLCNTVSSLGKSKEAHKIVENDRPLPEKTDQAEDEEIYDLFSGDEDYSKGVRKWVTDYYQSRPGIKVLQERIDEFITDHEAKKKTDTDTGALGP